MRDQNQAAGAPSLGVYAAAAALLSGIPVPIVDGLLSDAARGAAFRRVAARRGVRLPASARKALVSQGTLPKAGSSRFALRAVRSLAQRMFLPARLATRAEMAARALVETRLFEDYFELSERREGAPITVPEAERVRAAMDEALREGVGQVPGALFSRIRAGLSELSSGEDEHDDRALFERAIDSLLDNIADVPEEALAPLRARFSAALAGRPV